MNEELTNEVLEAIRYCRGADYMDCEKCPAFRVCDSTSETICKWLAEALLEERAKPKVWEFAPITVDRSVVHYYVGDAFFGEKTYTRELPKTRVRKDAEELFDELSSQCLSRKQGIDAIEDLLNKYTKDLVGKE